MKLVELSKKNLYQENKKLVNLINKDYQFDLIIFVAKGAFLIAKDVSNITGIPMIEVFSKRKGEKFKKIVRPILKIMPYKIKKALRSIEFNSNYHNIKSERKVFFDEKIWKKYTNKKNILILDDSIDTGYTIANVKKVVRDFFGDVEIRIASLNCFSKSKQIINTDYYIYRDTMLKGPWSNDSNEYESFMKEYSEWHEKQ